MSEEPILSRAPSALARRTLRGVLIAAPGAEEPVLITTPGDAVWELLDRPQSRPDLIATLAAAYDEAPTTIAADIDPVLDLLVATGALVERPA